MTPRLPLKAALAAGFLALAAAPAFAHGVVGPRFFPATLATDDPAVADELSLPTVATFEDADGTHETDVSGEYSKRIFENLGVSIAPAWTRLHAPDGSRAEGWRNLETTLKYQFVTDPKHELILSTGVSAEWGGSGSQSVGAEKITAITPTLYFGKGFGDLPKSLDWARPFAVTGTVGYQLPAQDHVAGTLPGEIEKGSRAVAWGLALEYSMPYLASQVRDMGFPEFVNRLTPLVEASFTSPVAPTGDFTTGTINPGVIWAGRRFQLGAEAMIPLNRQSGRGVGGLIQLHFYLDDIFPHSIGRPLIQRKFP
jgi:hypothetical protein